MNIRQGRLFGAFGAAFALFLGSSTAEANEFDWLAIAYVWAADIDLDSRDINAGVSFSETVENLEMGFQGHVEAQADDFGGFVDVSFMAIGTNELKRGIRVNSDVDMTAMDLAAVWSPADEPMTGVEVFGGLRYIDTDVSLTLDPQPPGPPVAQTGIDSSYYDALLGARYLAPINDRWRLVFSADVSGGDTEGTWSIGGYGVYRTGPHRFYAGYRHLEMDIEGRAGQKLTETYSGPAIAYGYAF